MSLFSPLVLADTQRLEEDLAHWSDAGHVRVGEVRQVADDLSRASNISIVENSDTRLQVEQYDVEGDYDAPDRVVMSGLVLTAPDVRMEVGRLVIDEPSKAVWELDHPELELSAANIVAQDVTLATRVSGADMRAYSGDPAPPQRITMEVDAIEALALDVSSEHGSLGSLTLKGLSSTMSGLDGWRLALESLALSDFSWGAPRGALLVGGMTLAELAVNKDDVQVAGITRLTSTSEITAERLTSHSVLDEAFVDFNQLIGLVPIEDRSAIRMVTNVMTGDSERFTMSGEGAGVIEARGASLLAHSDSHLDIPGSFGLTLDYEFPLALSKGQTAEELFTRFADYSLVLDPLEELGDFWLPVKPLGGHLSVVYHNQGMIDRLMSVAAVTMGQSRSELLASMSAELEQGEQRRSLTSPQVVGSVLKLLAGEASTLRLDLELPPSVAIHKLVNNPEGVVEHLVVTASTE
ncbi:hypothetical protein [Halomonas huangheensis]|nr:hypothetical protein [Halomonas huangheensis]ALM51654.1 hypothetical protein AR456_04655 [Halomonas huangheensis]